ncbi:unnamed protein product [Rhizophagus irregularis]|uniref:Uncharacterized protein n=1 Tax=Rhizophagus irregularis TaxID=588596 RepID=A0A915YN67_9GLOM|nr:hypothetical protein OCT59_030015 [Rhizophagus irregularis]GET63187.1 hypothetical protein RIR_jg20286.t1 [Rhizophagus irregularis DAOM 181602=DAOM 197198]CAB4400818.1 unnamed protein product [Rhizophagus irregularis]CAB4408710.1 unnamed protein product [Rhizophagus irregularis]CAB4473647.1 unnamed protein product [Rhizophagus irregularis]
MNPPLFFDHFKFEYAKKSTVDSFCPTLSKHVNAPVMRSLTQKKIKDLKVWREIQYANEYWQGIEIITKS